jgi:arabinofuranan 3-O-arabinosyltransferase
MSARTETALPRLHVGAPPQRAGRRQGRAERALFVGLGAAAVGAVFLNDWGRLTPDWVPQLYLAPGRTLLASLRIWKPDPYLGQLNIHVGLAPVAAVVAVLRGLGVPAWAAIRVLRSSLLLGAGWGAARLFRRVAGDRGGAAGRAAAAGLYVANPYVVVSGSLLPTLLGYALFPWLLLALARSIDRPRSWRGPAAFALTFFLMSGVNTGIVAIFMLLGVPCWIAYARLAEGVALRRGLAAAARCLALALLVSVYWIVPSLLAHRAGASIAATSERPRSVAATSSYSETLRLLGFWLQYGFRPNQSSYFADAPVVLASFAIPIAAFFAAWVSRARARVLAVMLLAVGAPVMVGMFPLPPSTPFGRTLDRAFDRIPGAMAFRTTNKAGPLVALALALLVGVGARHVWSRAGKARPAVAAGAVLVVALSTYPAWSGSLYASASKVPPYWEKAAADLNKESSASRVLLLPGDFLSLYRWGMREVEDVNDSLLSRPSVVRPVLMYSPPYAANYLAAMDVPLESGSYQRGLLPVMARYMGVSQILLRADMVWERSRGMRPSDLAREIAGDGFRLVASYGAPGEHTTARPVTDRTSPAFADSLLPPLQLFAVPDPVPIVRAEPARGTVLMAGDNFGLAPLPGLGLLSGDPPFRLVGSMPSGDLGQALRDGARLVLTDSNRRRIWTFTRLGAGYGPTLGADQGGRLGKWSYALSWNQPDEQTVTVLDGARSISASGYLSENPAPPSTRPVLAFDGDPQTAWLTTGYRRPRGQRITIEFDRPRVISHLTLHPVDASDLEIGAVELRVGARSFSVPLPRGSAANVDIPPTLTDALTIRIARTVGPGDGPVGFSEIEIPGIRATEFTRLPLTFSKLAQRLDRPGLASLLTSPLDVVLVRQMGVPSMPGDDEERAMNRLFALPVSRDFTFTAQARGSVQLPDALIDGLLGVPPGIVVRASSLSRSPLERASQALDGDPTTTWVPSNAGRGTWIDVRFSQRRLDHVTIAQGAAGQRIASFASEVELSFDGGPPIRARIAPGKARIDFPPRTAGEIRLTIARIVGLGNHVGIDEISIPGVRVPAARASTPIEGCLDLFEVDGVPVRARPEGAATLGQLVPERPLRFLPCGDKALRLGPGSHRLQSSPGWLIDLLDLSSDPGSGHAASSSIPAGARPPLVRLLKSSPTSLVVHTGPAPGPYFLTTGTSYDDRWRATMDGRSLGKPQLVDGYAVGWLVHDTLAHTFVISFGPQRWLNVGLLISPAGLLLIGALLWRKEPGAGGTAEPSVVGLALTSTNGHRRHRRLWGPLLLVCGLWFFGGVPGLTLAVGIVVAGRFSRAVRSRRGPRALLLVPGLLLVAVPMLLLIGGLPSAAGVDSGFVRGNVATHYLAGAALAMLVVFVLTDARRSLDSGPAEDGHGEPLGQDIPFMHEPV